jgi:hypothetical protein
MSIRIANQKEFAAGGLFVAIGVIWAIASTRLSLGQATHMGPGYFPLCMSIALVCLGLISMARSVRAMEQVRLDLERFPLVAFAFLLVGIVGFGLLVRSAGLVPASLFVVACCCHRLWLKRPLEAVAITIGFTVVAALIFVKGLGLPIDLF